jgi:excisionase family DNA binding protein
VTPHKRTAARTAAPSLPLSKNSAPSVARPPVGRLAYTKREAAEALGMSVDSLERHLLAELRVVRRGRLVLIPATELERWLSDNAARTLVA